MGKFNKFGLSLNADLISVACITFSELLIFNIVTALHPWGLHRELLRTQH